MNKTELIEAVAAHTELTKADAGRAVNAIIDVITHAVAKKDDVQLIGFGTFKISNRKARTGVNPKTGAKIKIKASKTVRFVPGKAFKGAI